MSAAPADRIVGNPVHRLLAIYALIAGCAAFFPNRSFTWPVTLAAHLMAAALLWPVPPFSNGWAVLTARWPRVFRVPLDLLPLLIIPALYLELAPLNLMVHGGRYFDNIILGVEHTIFGMPSRNLATHFPILWLSELLHAGYLSYYLIVFVPPIVLYFTNRQKEYRRALFAVLLSFFTHYLFFIYFPVQGPRYLFPTPTGPIARGNIFQLTHRLLEAGSSRGAAFPSSHVGVSVTQTLTMIRFMRRGSIVLGVLTVLLATGAVYGGFHYATDAFCGLLLGTAIAVVAPKIFDWFGGRWYDGGSGPNHAKSTTEL